MNGEKSASIFLMRAYESFCAFSLLVAVGCAIFEIIGRVFFNFSYDFVIDLSIWLTAWATLLMSGPLLLRGEHVSIQAIREKLRGRPRLYVGIFNNLSALAYSCVIAAGGFLVVYRHFKEYAVFPRYFPIPMWIVELSVPLGMSIFAICAFIVFIKDIRRKW
jgi:TRAP-type C4-dicarboxylate transport system permease small subunit